MEERFDWVVCGRLIGTATGWDTADTFSMNIYGLEPHADYHGPSGDVCITFESGRIESYDDNGKPLQSVDLLDAIKDCPREEL